MSLYKLVVAYDGTPFNGFQRQAATCPPGGGADEDQQTAIHG
jgi:hypothetical protein